MEQIRVMPPDIEITGLFKSFSDVPAVRNFSLSVPHGSFTTLLGPSGCGKTTVLRMIAGFIQPDRGIIRICGENQHHIPPDKRNIGIVFQDYALFPHMTVEENLVYGLKLRKWNADAVKDAVRDMSSVLGLDALLRRYPHELSGGQQQRAAVGRVLILKPRVLLMDEPLSSLDAKLRVRVREELKDLQNRLRVTTVYVTHDKEEALSLSDHIAVMRDGKLEQHSAPEQLYFHPATPFAADFAGSANFLSPNFAQKFPAEIPGTIVSVSFLGAFIRCKISVPPEMLAADPNNAASAVVRPEWFSVSAAERQPDSERCCAFPPPNDSCCIVADIASSSVNVSEPLRKGMHVFISVLRSAVIDCS
ncbi:MAG: ABC transporter ATP-binding protein [Bacteroides sp.]|nr:ABC transporter ATP-binding protein [Prevotella sp.]MCM1408403.1 ABC transporter ATP-binding protein [Treponema brennaborense]MCM1469435.1 ABC transporter ATP-binding protein [Bacteroides sp.]